MKVRKLSGLLLVAAAAAGILVGRAVKNGILSPKAGEDTGSAQGSRAREINPLTVKGKGASVSYSGVQRAPKTVARDKVLTVKKAHGQVSYDKISGPRKITVDKKTGAVTVRKGIKKGTYRVSVRVSAPGNSKYARNDKTATFRISVH